MVSEGALMPPPPLLTSTPPAHTPAHAHFVATPLRCRRPRQSWRGWPAPEQAGTAPTTQQPLLLQRYLLPQRLAHCPATAPPALQPGPARWQPPSTAVQSGQRPEPAQLLRLEAAMAPHSAAARAPLPQQPPAQQAHAACPRALPACQPGSRCGGKWRGCGAVVVHWGRSPATAQCRVQAW